MECGLFTEFPCPAGMSEATAFGESMAQMGAAEELGFDAVWLGELHFQKDRSVLASPLVVAAAIAARTRRVKIGIGRPAHKAHVPDHVLEAFDADEVEVVDRAVATAVDRILGLLR